MGRKSKVEERRIQILEAFAQVLADHGYSGATMVAVAAEAQITPSLLHHNFTDKLAMLEALMDLLAERFEQRYSQRRQEIADPLLAYLDATLKLDERSDLVTAKCWVGVFAEAIRNPSVLKKMRSYLGRHLQIISEASGKKLGEKEKSALLSMVVGSILLGPFGSRSSVGFVLPNVMKLADLLFGR
jgi:AcrR family transcriptional regulator